MTTEEELARRLADLEAREREVEKREHVAKAKSIRHNLYERITLSKRTVDMIIIACAVAIAALVVIGAVLKK